MTRPYDVTAFYACRCECGEAECQNDTLDSQQKRLILTPMTPPPTRQSWLCDRIDRALASAYDAGRSCRGGKPVLEDDAHDRAAHDEALMWEALRDTLTGQVTP